MEIVQLTDKSEIYDHLIKNKPLNIYSIGDLDDFFWPYTQWFGLKDNSELQAIVLLYTGLSQPTVLALSENIQPLTELFVQIRDQLPHRFYAHLSPGVLERIQDDYKCEPHGSHFKMNLTDWQIIENFENFEVENLTMDELENILDFYAEAYPGNWFDQRMLSTGHYYTLRRDNRIAGIAGVHVYSRDYKVAALGNISTHPDYRGRGIGYLTTAYCCKQLARTVNTIGLNVSQANPAAIALYKKLGFDITAEYEELVLEKIK